MTKNNSREHHCPLEPTLVLILNLPDYTGQYLHYKQNMTLYNIYTGHLSQYKVLTFQLISLVFFVLIPHLPPFRRLYFGNLSSGYFTFQNSRFEAR